MLRFGHAKSYWMIGLIHVKLMGTFWLEPCTQNVINLHINFTDYTFGKICCSHLCPFSVEVIYKSTSELCMKNGEITRANSVTRDFPSHQILRFTWRRNIGADPFLRQMRVHDLLHSWPSTQNGTSLQVMNATSTRRNLSFFPGLVRHIPNHALKN